MQIKLLKKGIKIDGVYYPVWYSSSANNINGNATIYCKTYANLPAELSVYMMDVQNDSEIEIDYIVKDRIRVSPNSEYFEQVEKLAREK